MTSPNGGVITPQIKSQFADTQKEPGLMIFNMETALADLKAAGELRSKETSKRWQAHYDYALARLMSRLVYIYEYNNILAQVRGDSLPPARGSIHNGWRVGSQEEGADQRGPRSRSWSRTSRRRGSALPTKEPRHPVGVGFGGRGRI